MPTDLIHRIGIAALAETTYRDLTTKDGTRAWWTKCKGKVKQAASGTTSDAD